MLRKSAFSILLCLLPAVLVAQASPPQPSAVDEDEYAVYAATLDFFRQAKKATHPIVADHTSSFACHSSCNGMDMGGCNGLRGDDETPAQRLAIVRRDLPQLTSATTGDFEGKNQSCSEIERKIPSKSKYLLFGVNGADQPPEGWDNPDYFYFSRVAFDREHAQALVVVGFMSGTKASDSAGKYFFFAKRSGKWDLVGTSDVWKLVP